MAASGETAAAILEASGRTETRLAVDICICTHNPRLELLQGVIAALAAQSAPPESFRVVLIDNLSEPPVGAEVLEPLRRRGVEARLVVEEELGLTQARVRAARETIGEWICFVDDDNVLAPNYLDMAFDHIRVHPDTGAFGGKLLLPSSVHAAGWAKPFLPFLGIKDLGEESRSAISASWCESEPAGAGAMVHRDVMDAFCKLVVDRPEAFSLGRRGGGLASCDDSLLMRGAYALGKAVAYDPKLMLQHYIDPERIRFGYLMRLMYAYGESQVVLERVLGAGTPLAQHYRSPIVAIRTLIYTFLRDSGKSLAFGIAMLGYHFSAWRAHQRLRAET